MASQIAKTYSPTRVELSWVQQVRQGILDWLESIRYQADTVADPAGANWGRWRYHVEMDRPYAGNATAWAIILMDELDALDRLTSTQRTDAIDSLRSMQDPADGYFKDPLVTEKDHVGSHTWEQIYGQWSIAADALKLLGSTPRFPLPAAQFVDLRQTDGATYTRSFDWADPWAHGESWSRGIRAFTRTPVYRSDHGRALIREALAVFEREVIDPQTGMPSRQMSDTEDHSKAMAGLFKTMNAYLDVGQPVPHAERAIDFTLELQHEDGEFGYRGNMCINWDALWVLRELDRQLHGTYRREDITAAGNRFARRALKHYRKPDGGFAFHGTHCQTNHHSIQLCDRPAPISDLFGTMMCLYCLQYADEWRTQPVVSGLGQTARRRKSVK